MRPEYMIGFFHKCASNGIDLSLLIKFAQQKKWVERQTDTGQRYQVLVDVPAPARISPVSTNTPTQVTAQAPAINQPPPEVAPKTVSVLQGMSGPAPAKKTPTSVSSAPVGQQAPARDFKWYVKAIDSTNDPDEKTRLSQEMAALGRGRM